MNSKTLLTFLFITSLGILSRLIPHLPNLTALNAIAFLSPFFFSNPLFAFFAAFSSLFITDLLLGFYITMPSVYLSYFVMMLIGISIKPSIEKPKSIYLPFCSLVFYLISNFGVWLSTNMYERSFEGLVCCYIAALPFIKYQWLGDFAYGSLLYKILPYFKGNAVQDYKKKESLLPNKPEGL